MAKRYTPKRGPLRGRTYKSRYSYEKHRAKYQTSNNFENFKRDHPQAVRDENRFAAENYKGKWEWLLHEYLDNKGYPTIGDRLQFLRLYAAARASGFNAHRNGPYAKLLDLCGVRPLRKFGDWNVGDTPEA